MSNANIERLLQMAFRQCEALGYALTPEQQQILEQVIRAGLQQSALQSSDGRNPQSANPLAQLTPEQRTALLQFIQEQQQNGAAWKTALLNDWLQNRSSGAVQFIRDQFGIQWLDTITPADLAEYVDEDSIPLKVGDRIEVSNALWEWVQEDGPCSREWFPCTVLSITENTSDPSQDSLLEAQPSTTCTVRFDSGSEYEIQGMYEWNRPNWRWAAKGERQ